MGVWKIFSTPYSNLRHRLRLALLLSLLCPIGGGAANPPTSDAGDEPPQEDAPQAAPQNRPYNPMPPQAPMQSSPQAPLESQRATPRRSIRNLNAPLPNNAGRNTATPTPRAASPVAGDNGVAPVLRRGEMLFNFQDADIQAVVKTVSQMTNRNFLIDPRVKGKITIISSKPVSGNAVYQIFLSALKAQGFTAVEGPSGIVKIVPEGEGKQNAVVSSGDAPRGGDQLATQVVTIQHGSATQMVPLLRPLMAPSALLSVYAPGNTLILTDYADNIRRLLKIIDKLDQPGSTEVVVIPLEHASALDMAQLLSKLADNVTVQVGQPQPQPIQQAGADAMRVSIVPDLRTNSLLVRTDNVGRLNQIRSLIAKLDVPARSGGNTRVVYLRNAEAVKLAEVLRGLLAGEARAQSAQTTGVQPVAAAGAATAAKTAEASLIQADEASNALIISAPDSVYNNLRAVIEKLDLRRAQVFIEALIAEVSADRAAEFGFQWAGGTTTGGENGVGAIQNFNSGGGTSLTGVVASALTPPGVPAVGDGLAVAFLGHRVTLPDGRQVIGVGALAKALEGDTNVNVLAKPTLLTLDNSEAKIVVAQNIPFITGQYAQTGAANTATTNTSVNPFQTIDRQDVGLTLKIKPQISEGNTVRLTIAQENSDVTTVPNAVDLATNKRSIETRVIVDDGFTIVLGGLLQDRVEEQTQAVPVLSRIPILGELFKYRKRTKRKTNLMVFLRPVIVRDVEQGNTFTAERYDYMRNAEERAKMSKMWLLPSYEQPKLPELVQPPLPPKVPRPQSDNTPANTTVPRTGAAEPTPATGTKPEDAAKGDAPMGPPNSSPAPLPPLPSPDASGTSAPPTP